MKPYSTLAMTMSDPTGCIYLRAFIVNVVLSYSVSITFAFTLWNTGNGEPSNTDPLFSSLYMCPMTDCGPIEAKLECAHQDRYITTVQIMGLTCSGCPACRDYGYFVSLSEKTTQMAGNVLIKVIGFKDVLQKIKESAQSVRMQSKRTSTSTDPLVPEDVTDSIEELLEEVSQKLYTLTEDSAMVKVARYLEENAQELEDIVQYGTFLQSRMDLNTNGFYSQFWLPSVQQYDISMLPFFKKDHFVELLNDLVLDRVAELMYTIQRIKTATEIIQRLVGNLKDGTDEQKLEELEEQSPLMLRRIYQLLESNAEAFRAFSSTNLTEIQTLLATLQTRLQQRQSTEQSDT